jgi:Ca-activated chloride channel family protein
VPFALVLAALAALGLACARPQLRVDVPVSASTLILALDVSGSMCSTDVEPNRLSAAQAAVRDFVRGEGSDTRIGLVVFSGFAQLAVEPTTDRDDLIKAIDSLTTGRGTTIGAAILKAIDAIAQVDPDVAPAGDTASSSSAAALGPQGSTGQTRSRAPGSYAPEIVVLLTDGANTRGVTPLEAARVAAARGVRVYPIGFGTTHPTTMVCTPEQLGGSGFEGFRGGGPGVIPRSGSFLVADEPTLREVASITGGTYFPASGADQLNRVLSDLPQQVQVQKRTVEMSVGLAGLAVLFVLLSVVAAARWTPFPA